MDLSARVISEEDISSATYKSNEPVQEIELAPTKNEGGKKTI